MKEFRRGDIYWCDLSPAVGSEQAGLRPVLIISNNIGNHFSPAVTVASISTSEIKYKYKKMPTHVYIEAGEYGLPENSIVLLEQIRTVDKLRLGGYVGKLDKKKMREVKSAIEISFSDELDYTPKRQLQCV